MGRALAEAYPSIRSCYEESSSVLGYDIAALCFDWPAEQVALRRSQWPVIAWENTRLLLPPKE